MGGSAHRPCAAGVLRRPDQLDRDQPGDLPDNPVARLVHLGAGAGGHRTSVRENVVSVFFERPYAEEMSRIADREKSGANRTFDATASNVHLAPVTLLDSSSPQFEEDP
jgi:hypothetical protein